MSLILLILCSFLIVLIKVNFVKKQKIQLIKVKAVKIQNENEHIDIHAPPY